MTTDPIDTLGTTPSPPLLSSEIERLHRRFPEFLGRSVPLMQMLQELERAAASEASLLIQGESGTGKELVGRAIHRIGPRRSGPFVSENCAAIPVNLLESEFFGHVRGAFTGATRDKRGLFEVADQGT